LEEWFTISKKKFDCRNPPSLDVETADIIYLEGQPEIGLPSL
jgi:hypothetical protein